ELHIVGEHFLPIRFQLCAPKGASLATVKDVYSHVHALGQCRKIIRKLGLVAHVAADTAGSAREVAEWGDMAKASLATSLAAQFFATMFYAEVDGHPDDLPLARALEELEFFSREFRILGVFPAHPFRDTFKETRDRG